jgi:hypothetical protein
MSNDNNVHYSKIDFRLFFKLSLAFVLFTIIGTLTHELGHIIVAKLLGYHTHLAYGFMYCLEPKRTWTDRNLITLGGPLQTVLTGSVGLFFLYRNRKSYQQAQSLSFGQWAIIFISLFWLRQAANLFVELVLLLTKNSLGHGDERWITQDYGLPPFTILGITGIIGLLILAVIYFRFIPQKEKFTFLLSGLTGGMLGYWCWLIQFGPMVMP